MNPEAFSIEFNDEYVVVVNKLVKILVVPTEKNEKYTLTSLLEEKLKEKVFPCHRLDRETTGLVIYAKSKQTQHQIMDQFRAGTVKKRYVALVQGKMPYPRGTIEGKILDTEGRKYGEKEKPAKTYWQVLGHYTGYSLLELVPLTGRTNQLRIQLSQMGHPILGEDKYAFRRDFTIRFKRLALHAKAIIFTHPISQEEVKLRLDLPQDMKDFLKSV